jgi:hypothetical protein
LNSCSCKNVRFIIHNNDTKPVRKTIDFDVPKGQYDVRRRVSEDSLLVRFVARVVLLVL